jgi:ribosome-binding factor A
MESQRQQKFAKQLTKDLAEIFQKVGLSVYNGAMITITQVKTSPDLRTLKIYLSIFGAANKEDVLKDIRDNHTKEVRYHLGNKIRNAVKSIPELYFYIDDSLDYSENIDKLFDELNKDKKKED